jgi:hypothetical protein
MARATSKSSTNPTAFLNAVNRIRLSKMISDPLVAAAFKAVEDDCRVAPPSQRQPAQPKPAKPTPIRALTIFDSLPRNHRTVRISDDASAPHLKAGEFAVVDTADRGLQAGELYVIQYSSGHHVVQIRSTRSGWWASDLAGYRQTDEKMFGVPVFAGMSDGPYTPSHLKKKLLGRVVGYAETALGGLLLDK